MSSYHIVNAIVTLLISTTFSGLGVIPLFAGEQGGSREEVKDLRARIDSLTAEHRENSDRIGVLEEELLELLEESKEDTVGDLSNEIDAFLGSPQAEQSEPEEEVVFTSSQRQLRELNPEISILGDFFGIYRSGSHSPGEGGEHVEGEEQKPEDSHEPGSLENGFALNEVEISFQAPLDPYSLAKFFVGLHEGQVDVEEAYAEWTNLPGRMQLKLGKFRGNFGTLNRWHPHALPTYALPLTLRNLFGEEGLIGIGGSLTFLLPGLWADYNEFSVEVINGDNQRAFSGVGFRKPVGLFHLKNYYDLNRSTYLELGLSGAVGENDPELDNRTSIEGVDLSVVWSPPERSKYRGMEFRTEAFSQQRETPSRRVDTFNISSFVDIRFARRWTGGVRFDYIQDSYDREERTYEIVPFFTFWQSEFVRLRLQYGVTNGPGAGGDWDHLLLFQSTFALGPHKHEKY